ncbi:hypothetical protein L1887_22551 [Cichorium endivia]|nr:hypothetical protein L1887_22551 [Cichorium endivia]
MLKHVDVKTLGAAACMSRQWHHTAYDERLCELISTRNWANIICGSNQLCLVVFALSGFRCLYSHYLLSLSKPTISVEEQQLPSMLQELEYCRLAFQLLDEMPLRVLVSFLRVSAVFSHHRVSHNVRSVPNRDM